MIAGPYDFVILLACAALAVPGFHYCKEQGKIQIEKLHRQRLDVEHDNRMHQLRLKKEAEMVPLEMDAEFRVRRAMLEQRNLAMDMSITVMRERMEQIALTGGSEAANKIKDLAENSDIKKVMAKTYYQQMVEANTAKNGKPCQWANYVESCSKRYIKGGQILDAEIVSQYLSDVTGEIVQVPPFEESTYAMERA
jgi:Tfp pilus assembly major pilin PilA